MSYPHQPGSPSFEGGAAHEAYQDEMAELRAEIEQMRSDLELRNQTALDRKEAIARLEARIEQLEAENLRAKRLLAEYGGDAALRALARKDGT